MASGFLVSGTDLDSLLAALGSFTAISNVGFQVAGTDISQRYAPASAGTPGSATGFQSSGTDVGPLFAAFGSTVGYSGTLTAAHSGSSFGFSSVGGYGSITPTTFRSRTITGLLTVSTSNTTSFSIASATNPLQSFFATLVTASFTRNSSAASYSYTGGVATWTWTATNMFPVVGTYAITIS